MGQLYRIATVTVRAWSSSNPVWLSTWLLVFNLTFDPTIKCCCRRQTSSPCGWSLWLWWSNTAACNPNSILTWMETRMDFPSSYTRAGRGRWIFPTWHLRHVWILWSKTPSLIQISFSPHPGWRSCNCSLPALAQHPSTLIMRPLHGQRAIIAARVVDCVVELDTFSSLVSQDHRRKTHHYGRWQMAHLPVETLQGGSKERNETNSSRVICNGKKRSRHVFSSPTILQGRVKRESVLYGQDTTSFLPFFILSWMYVCLFKLKKQLPSIKFTTCKFGYFVQFYMRIINNCRVWPSLPSLHHRRYSFAMMITPPINHLFTKRRGNNTAERTE